MRVDQSGAERPREITGSLMAELYQNPTVDTHDVAFSIEDSDEETFGLPDRYVELCLVGQGGYGAVMYKASSLS